MKILEFPEDAYIVTRADADIFDGLLSAPVVVKDWPAGVSGRCKVTLSSSGVHTDCAGTITIGSETLTFVQAGTKITSTLLTAKPVITFSGLDCHCRITIVDAGGAPIKVETKTATKIQFENTASGFFASDGTWKVYSGSYAMCRDAAGVGDIIRYGSVDMPIVKVDTEKWFSKTIYYIFYL